jgi:flagellar L-ring protein FlgH
LRLLVPARLLIAVYIAASPAISASGQSSSLYLRQEPTTSSPVLSQDIGTGALSQAIASNSFIAVQIPEPRQYAENDLVTIIIRESFKTDLRSILKTEKDVELAAEITAIPELEKLLELVVTPETFPNGNPELGITATNDLDGKGRYQRIESMTGRMTARIVDVKPNGTLVLEAHQSVANDEEIQAIILTGTCRASDITVDNTVLSTELYDLSLSKQHKGELKKATSKGFLTKFFEAIFNF